MLKGFFRQVALLSGVTTARLLRWFKDGRNYCFDGRPQNNSKSYSTRDAFYRLPATNLLLILMVGMSPALAQTTPSAGQLTPRSFEPQTNQQQPSFSFTPSETMGAPPGADKAHLNIRKVVLKGGDAAFTERTEEILSAVRGRNLPVSAFYEAAAKVQQLYSENGYFLVRVVIPPQDVKNGGVLKLEMIDGFIESVNIEGLAPQLKQRVARTLARLIGERHLKRGAFDRALLLAADTPGLDLKSNLAPAKADYGTVLTVVGV
jgi:hemolysin activation/secretion protein